MSDKIPDYQTLMYPALSFLGDKQTHSLDDLSEHLAKYYQLSEEDLRVRVPSGQQPLFKNRLTWTISYLKNAGLLQTIKRGTYQITSAGEEVLANNVRDLNTNYLKKLEGFKPWQESNQKQTTPGNQLKAEETETKTPEELIGINFEKINSELAIELLDVIKQKTPAQFERFVLELLNRLGYGGAVEKNFEVVGQSGDNGIDGIIYQDKLGIDRIYVQAKKWDENKVHSKEIRDFIGSLSLKGTNKGVFITTSQFTSDAMRTVEMNPQNIIILIDGKKLTDFAIQHNVGVQVKNTYKVKTLDADFFEEL